MIAWSTNLNLDQFIDQTIDNLYRVMPNYAEINKRFSAAEKLHKSQKALNIHKNQAFTEVLAT